MGKLQGCRLSVAHTDGLHSARRQSRRTSLTKAGNQGLELRVKDLTRFIASSMSGSLLVHSRSWMVQVTAVDLIFEHGSE